MTIFLSFILVSLVSIAIAPLFLAITDEQDEPGEEYGDELQ